MREGRRKGKVRPDWITWSKLLWEISLVYYRILLDGLKVPKISSLPFDTAFKNSYKGTLKGGPPVVGARSAPSLGGCKAARGGYGGDARPNVRLWKYLRIRQYPPSKLCCI